MSVKKIWIGFFSRFGAGLAASHKEEYRTRFIHLQRVGEVYRGPAPGSDGMDSLTLKKASNAPE